MINRIPSPLISLLSDELPEIETHANLDSLFLYCDAPELPNKDALSKAKKVQNWLSLINNSSSEPLVIFGRLIENYMELPELEEGKYYEDYKIQNRERIKKLAESITKELNKYGLSYAKGGFILSGGSLPSRDLSKIIHDKDIPAINLEFERALNKVNSEPLEAVSACSNLLESICKVYIEDNGLEMPNKKDLKSLWKVVSKNLGFDASKIQDDDLRRIISGMFSIVDGIASLRTHGSSAHGQGKQLYKPSPRHARFAVNAAHSLALFLLETIDK